MIYGDRGGQVVGPSLPFHLFGNVPSKNRRTYEPQCGGAPSCWKIIHVMVKKIYVFISRSFLVISVCNQRKTLCSPCICNVQLGVTHKFWRLFLFLLCCLYITAGCPWRDRLERWFLHCMQQIVVVVVVRMYTRLRKLPARNLDGVNDHVCSFRRSSLKLQANCGDNRCIVAGHGMSYGCVDSVPDFLLLTGYCNKINVSRPSSFGRVLCYYGPEFYNGDRLQEIHWWCQHFNPLNPELIPSAICWHY